MDGYDHLDLDEIDFAPVEHDTERLRLLTPRTTVVSGTVRAAGERGRGRAGEGRRAGAGAGAGGGRTAPVAETFAAPQVGSHFTTASPHSAVCA
ncbi:DUF6417 family protein [Streptomyces sp. NBC_00080]|uniref:DUF6417 family protein n=1 Tax=Streptomyces sp. NBC_00080 TaxID=2975645 RepID=UPI00386E92DE